MRQGFVVAQVGETMTSYIAAVKASGDPVAVYKAPTAYHFRIINSNREEGQRTLELIEALAK